MTRETAVLAAAAALLCAGAAQAAEEGEARWSLSGTIGVVSDYQYRGYSLSGGDPAVQGDLTLTAPGGWYGTVWTSAIEEYGVGPDGDGALVEVDYSLGRGFSAGGWDWDVAVYYYSYPDATDVNYLEVPVSAARTVGDFTTTLGLAWAPEQDNLGGEGNTYVYLGGAYAPEHWPVSVSGQIGHEDGAFADGKYDWQLGLSKSVGPATFGVTWSDSDGPGAESTVVWSASVGF
ncbi:MAG: TorF family putative porin [Pseudomonadota bacterium]